MSEPWSKEQLKRIKEVYDSQTCETTKAVLKELAPEAFVDDWKKNPLNGTIVMEGSSPGILCWNGKDMALIYLDHGGWNWFDTYKKSCNLLASGTITLTVKDGKIIDSEVKED